jgi:hypothetical protein
MKTARWLSLATTAVALSSAPAEAQSGYAITFGGSSFEEGVGASLDEAGNGYYTGTFRGTVDFDPDTSTVELTAAGEDVYVVSYDGDGRLRFAFNIGNAFGTDEYVGDIAARADGSFVVTGTQPFGAIDYDPDPTGIEERAGIIYIAGYDNSGSFEFAVAAPGLGTANSGAGESVAFDPSGNVYVAGSFVGTIDLAGIGSSGPGVISSVSSTDGFVASYEPNGVFRNALRIAGDGAVAALGVTADARGNVFVTGRRKF